MIDVETIAFTIPGKKKSLYPNKKVTAFGHTFDSKKEYERYLDLLDMQRRGEIAELKPHPKFKLWSGDKPIVGLGGKFSQRVYTADFSYIKDGKLIIEDVKPRKKALKKPKKGSKAPKKDKAFITPYDSLRMSIFEAHSGIKIDIIF